MVAILEILAKPHLSLVNLSETYKVLDWLIFAYTIEQCSVSVNEFNANCFKWLFF